MHENSEQGTSRSSTVEGEKNRRSNSITKSLSEDGDVVARIQNATQNVMGRISGNMSRIGAASAFGGIANKFGGGILKFP